MYYSLLTKHTQYHRGSCTTDDQIKDCENDWIKECEKTVKYIPTVYDKKPMERNSLML